MKKSFFKYFVLLALTLSIVLALGSCALIEGLLPGGDNEGEPCTHVDADRDGSCDECGEKVQSGGGETKPEIPSLDGVVFEDKTVIYNGSYHSIEVDPTTVPEGITVLHSTNRYMNAGEYTVTADFYYAGAKLEGKSITATLTINKADYDFSGIALLGMTKTYDGTAAEVSLEGRLPSGVSVSYVYKNAAGEEVEEMVDAGVYTVYAVFSGDQSNYYEAAPMSTTVEIKRAHIGGISFKDARFVYDGEAKSISVTGVPDHVKVSYTDNVQTEVGIYTVVASFEVGPNYDHIDDMTAKLEIYKLSADMSDVSLGGATYTFDGTDKMPTLVGTLPSGVTYEIVATNEAGEVVTELVNVGVYTVTATFNYSVSYEPIAPIVATVVIEKASINSISFKDAHFTYDGEAKSVLVTGLPTFVGVTYTGNGKVAPGVYTVTASFSLSDNYFAIPDMTATMTITLDNPLGMPTATLTYEEVNGGYAVTGITDSPVLIVIPKTYNGKNVVEIKSNAFRGMDGLEFVYIPETVEKIGNAAFMDCTALKTLYLADFSVTVGDDGNLVTVGSSALKILGQKAFANTAIKVVDLPDSITAMGIGVFEGCDSIEKITVPFIGGSKTTSHPFIGYLFGADMAETQVYSVPKTLTEVIISNNCAEIPAYAFIGLTSLKSVYVGQSVLKIGNRAFSGCNGLRDIYLPKSVVSIPVDAEASYAPFFGCGEDFMIVIEDVASTGDYGKYYSYVTEGASALVVLNKSYEDYIMNKDSFRVADPADSSAAAIFYGGVLIPGFSSTVYEYSIDVDINVGMLEFSVLAGSTLADCTVDVKDGVATITIVSGDGKNTTVYTVKTTVTGEFKESATVVNKGGADATVSFVVDDGFIGTAEFCKSMLEKYPNLSLTFAIYTKKFATLKTEDPDGDGIKNYVMDENGKYTYDVDQYLNGDASQGTVVDFWRDILSSTPGRSEIVSHSHTHQYWGYNDDGGSMFALSNANKMSRSPTTVASGSVTAEMYASIQIVRDLFGDLGSLSKTFVIPGIAARGSTAQLAEDTTILLRGHVVRLTADTAVSVDGSGEITVNSPTEIDLTSVKLTIPAGTPISTTVAYENNVIPAGSVIRVVECSMVVPAGTTINGHGTYWNVVKNKALDELLYIGSRNTGASASLNKGIYTKDFFTSKSNRKDVKSFGISTSDVNNDASTWTGYIDTAVEMKGWVSYCIHAITDTLDSNIENQGGHMITKTQGEILFKHAVEYGDKLWISTYSDATMYYHEWATSTVTSEFSGNAITVSLTDKEDDSVYNMALTVKVAVPGIWTSANVGDNLLEIVKNSDGSAYVLVDVVPETSVVIRGN